MTSLALRPRVGHLFRVLLAATAGAALACSASGQVVISQTWGGSSFQALGPNADCVELFNRGSAPVNFSTSGWTLQLATGTGTVWGVVPLTGTIQPGGYYLVQIGNTSVTGTAIPTPDQVAIQTTDYLLSSTGKAALVSNATALAGACPLPNAAILDFVSINGTCFEGTGPAPAGQTGTNPPTGQRRKNGGCTDTDNNAADWELVTPPVLRNSSSPGASGGVFVAASPSVNPVNAGGSVTLNVSVSACAGAGPTITGVTGDLTAFGLGAAVAFTGGPPTWSFVLNVPVSQAGATYSIPLSATDGTNTYAGAASLRVIGPPPANDLCAGARILATFPATLTDDNTTATADADPGTCNTGTAGNFGVWYVITPTTPGSVIINETSTQDIASGVWVIPSANDPLTDCSTIAGTAATICNAAENFGFAVTPGNRYYIQLGAASTTAPTVPIAGSIDFVSVAPANDACVNATDLTGATFPSAFSIDNRFANDDVDPGTCTTPTVGQQGVWFRLTAATNGVIQLNETGTQDIAWGVWQVAGAGVPASDCSGFSSGNSVFCSGTDTAQNVQAIAGNTYYIQLSNASTTSTPLVAAAGSINFVLAPASDVCSGATVIPATVATTPQQFLVDNSAASSDPIDIGACNLSTLTNATNGVWFRYSHTGPAATMLLNEVSTQNIATGVWDVDTTGATCPTAGPATVCDANEAFTFAVLPGRTYFILIHTDSATVSTIPIDVTFSLLTPPANDDCPTAISLATLPAAFAIDNRGAVSGALDPGTCTTATVANFDVWFRYDATAAGILQVAETSPQDIVTAAWTSPTASAVCPTSGAPTVACVTGDIHNIVVAAGTTYFIQVSQTLTTLPAAALSLRFAFFPVPPTNDECAGAVNLPGTGVFSLSNVGATTGVSNTPIACPTTSLAMNNDTWYRWVAPASGTLALNTRTMPTAFSGRYALYDGAASPGTCPSAGGPLGCNLFAVSSSTAALTAPVVGGNVYYLQIASQTAGSTGVVDVELVLDPTDAERCCIGASGCTLVGPTYCAQIGGIAGGAGSVCAAIGTTVSSYTGAGGAIPDGSTGTSQGQYLSSITVPDIFTIDTLEVEIAFAHTHAGDILIELSRGADSIVLSNRGRRNATPAGLASPDFVNTGVYTFTDSATGSVFDQIGLITVNPIPPGPYRPASILGVSPSLREVFNGRPAAGVWSLRILDQVGVDTGTVTSWTLRLTRGTDQCVPSTVVCCRGVTCATVANAAACTAPAGVGIRVLGSGTTSCAGQSAINDGCCYADFNKSGVKDVADIFAYLSAWFANSPFSDVGGDGTGTRDVSDIFQFLSGWFAGCA
ncbi:MAG: lamin tail domain-containing protein [Phycisphaerales bacterium]|nr:lamin tail domain-containing protein [Phycisphaerales bacterium]